MSHKRLTALALCAGLVLSLTACQSGDPAASSSQDAAPAGVAVQVEQVEISSIATGLIVGILVNVIFNKRSAEEKGEAKAE